MQAALALEPLAGKTQGDGGAGGGADLAEGEEGGGPGFGARGVRRKDRAADVVNPDEVHHPALDHRQRLAVQLDVFADQRAGGIVVFGRVAPVEQGRWVSPTLRSLHSDRNTDHAAYGMSPLGVSGSSTSTPICAAEPPSRAVYRSSFLFSQIRKMMNGKEAIETTGTPLTDTASVRAKNPKRTKGR